MPEGKDYLGNLTVDPNDKLDSGVKGMKWGVRRSSSQLKTAAAQRETKASTSPSTKESTGVESSAARYSRLQSQAKSGQASSLSDVDLKFYNARTEALSKVSKMNEQKPGWLSETAKKVLQDTARAQLASIAAASANKYISDPIIANIKDNSLAIAAESKTPVDYVGKRRATKKS